MWPQVPESLSSLAAEALRSLAREIKAVAVGKLSDATLSAEDNDEVAKYLAIRDEAIALAKTKEAAAKKAAELADDDDDDDPVVEAATEDPEPEGDDPEPEVVPSTEAATVPKVKTTFGSTAKPTVTPGGKGAKITPEYLTATDGVAGKNAGDGFADWRELAMAAVKRSENIRTNTSEKFEVARIVGEYPKERQLTDDVNFNMARFEPDELMATLCAPATPYYNLACANTLRRPVFNSLPQFQAPRFKVSIMSSPTLSDITTGYGIWDEDDDANTNATKSACQTITCGTPTEFVAYGVYRCLTVKNMLAMSYPELVEAWLNRLGAAHARLAETQLLDAMSATAETLDAPALGYGGSVTITSTILNYLALYQETQRWDISDNMEAWLPRWVLWGMKMDIVRRRRNDGAVQTVPTDGDVESMLRNAGVNPHWFIDTPTWAVAVPPVKGAGATLNILPKSVQVLIAPPAKYAVIDRGELAIGVTGNNIYRDNTSNSRNEFTFFFENFEGIVDTTSCPAHILDIPVCWNGVQIDDIVIGCEGGDVLSVGS